MANQTAVNNKHNFATTAARDTYFTADPIELVENLFVSVVVAIGNE